MHRKTDKWTWQEETSLPELKLLQTGRYLKPLAKHDVMVILDECPSLIWQSDPNGKRNYFNTSWLNFTGRTLERELGDGWTAGIHPKDLEQCTKTYLEAVNARKPFEMEYRQLRYDGEYRWVLEIGRPFYTTEGEFTGFIGSCSDVAERIKAEEAVKAAYAELDQIFNTAVDSMRVIDKGFNMLRINQNLSALLGVSQQEALKLKCYEAFAGPYCRTPNCPVVRVQKGEKRVEYEVEKELPNGRRIFFSITAMPFLGADGNFMGIVENLRDITERKQTEATISRLAYYDPLTALPNRTLFYDRLSWAMAAAEHSREILAVMFLDLDGFKDVNDSFGHSVGDKLLAAIAERLQNILRKSDIIARLGGDEFTILLSGLSRVKDVDQVARKIMEGLQQPLLICGHELFISASMGISMYPMDGTNLENLVKNADIAMYSAKNLGKNNYQFFNHSNNKDLSLRIKLRNQLRGALERQEFVLYYQPLVDLKKGSITGVEALIRWRHPDLGLVPPASFIPLAEETGLIIAIGKWVLEEACLQNQAWQAAGLNPIRIAVNLSAYQLEQPGFTDMIFQILQETGLPPEYLELEITESIALEQTVSDRLVLDNLRQRGLRISLDDFGTGYSSLSCLKDLPLDNLKIDRSFIQDLNKDTTIEAIASAIITLARNLNLKVTAEGVETEEQAAFLKQQGCDFLQGYFFSEPLPVQEISKLLMQQSVFYSEGKK